ncbi:MAG: Sua5/YciO/YrdC/YwlC family protein, partial [Phycisphaeraceae bacterium]|nr:Sua5/YciO/YrdC/YwlC family protein [Phycisphaeraceae bacterium]
MSSTFAMRGPPFDNGLMSTQVTTIRAIDAGGIAEAADQAGSAMHDGQLAVFPTETVYGIACKVAKESLARLDEVKGREEGKRYTLHVGNKGDIKKYVPKIDLRMSKLIENCLSGPLTIVFE